MKLLKKHGATGVHWSTQEHETADCVISPGIGAGHTQTRLARGAQGCAEFLGLYVDTYCSNTTS